VFAPDSDYGCDDGKGDLPVGENHHVYISPSFEKRRKSITQRFRIIKSDRMETHSLGISHLSSAGIFGIKHRYFASGGNKSAGYGKAETGGTSGNKHSFARQ